MIWLCSLILEFSACHIAVDYELLVLGAWRGSLFPDKTVHSIWLPYKKGTGSESVVVGWGFCRSNWCVSGSKSGDGTYPNHDTHFRLAKSA